MNIRKDYYPDKISKLLSGSAVYKVCGEYEQSYVDSVYIVTQDIELIDKYWILEVKSNIRETHSHLNLDIIERRTLNFEKLLIEGVLKKVDSIQWDGE